jgi:ribosomal protein S13
MSKKHDTHETESNMPRGLCNKKLISTILTAIFAAGTATGYFVLPSSQASEAKQVRELEAKCDKDIESVREALDDLRVSASKSEAKLDLLVQMLRDHANGGGKP